MQTQTMQTQTMHTQTITSPPGAVQKIDRILNLALAQAATADEERAAWGLKILAKRKLSAVPPHEVDLHAERILHVLRVLEEAA